MIAEYSGSGGDCRREEINGAQRLSEILRIRVNGANEYWLSESEGGYPCLAVLIKCGQASVTYFPEDGHPGFAAAGDAGTEGFFEFELTTSQDTIEVGSDMVIPESRAVGIAEEFFRTGRKPECTEWIQM